ncbi:hypothetical protein D8674_000068 [Pyrus ussuriensis x Pyrus communis]|uniref:Uncharacterized protein n=1 Tax=Pyrus ussuriensis x Pyrus communis TaxID=2448454 RepID=A0A5N5F209_9ROSA|nr:hypothetical protein D8674_000068 [Pyrus ussuriensis x Pyrus communis]
MRYSFSDVNDMTAAVVAKNLLTPKDNKLLSKRSDELVVKDYLAFSVQCAGSVHFMPSSSGPVPHTEAPNDQPLVPPLSGAECSLVERDSGIMSESGSPSDEGSPSSSFRFELAMLESSGPLLESCTKETLDDLRNCQTLANIGSSSFMSMGEGVMCPVKACPGYAECACRSERERIVFVTRGNIKLSGWELADVEKVLRVPKEDRHLGKLQPLLRKYGFQPLVSECQRRARRRSTVDELGEPLDENKSDRDLMMRLSSYVMTEYDYRLREVEWYKAKFKENNQLVNDARKMSKALAEAIRLKDQHFESLKRRNGENVRLKKQLEGTGKQLETTILEVSKVKGELDSALVEVSELKSSIPTERDAFHDAFRPHCIRAANFEKRKWMAVLELDPSSEDDSDNKASVGEQSRESEDGSGDAEDRGDAQLGQRPLYQRQVRMEFLLLKSNMKCGMTKELGRRAYSIATLSGVVRTSPAPQPCWLDEPSTYRVHTGSVGDVKLSYVRTLKYLSKRVIAYLSVALEMNLVKAATLPIRLWMSFEVTGSFMSMIALIFSGFRNVTGEAYQTRNRVIEQVFSYIKCSESFSKHDIDRRPCVYQDSSYVKIGYCRVVNQTSALSLLGGGVKEGQAWVGSNQVFPPDRCLMLINTLMSSSLPIRDIYVECRWSPVLGGTQVMVDFPGADEFVCLSMPSFMEHPEELLILLLEDLILYRYLVVLSL